MKNFHYDKEKEQIESLLDEFTDSISSKCKEHKCSTLKKLIHFKKVHESFKKVCTEVKPKENVVDTVATIIDGALLTLDEEHQKPQSKLSKCMSSTAFKAAKAVTTGAAALMSSAIVQTSVNDLARVHELHPNLFGDLVTLGVEHKLTTLVIGLACLNITIKTAFELVDKHKKDAENKQKNDNSNNNNLS